MKTNLKYTKPSIKTIFIRGDSIQEVWLNQGTKKGMDNQFSCKAWCVPVEYPCKEYKFDIKEFHGKMFSPIFLKKA